MKPLAGEPGGILLSLLALGSELFMSFDHRYMCPVADAKVVFPEGHEPSEYVNRVIECSWDADASAWRYMRHRLDKETPNAYHVYEKVPCRD